MFNTIIVPIALDHRENVSRKMDIAQKLCAPDGTIIAVAVLEDIPAYVAEYTMVKPDRARMVQWIKQAFDATLEGYRGIEKVTLTGKPGVVLSNYAKERGADLIVTAASRPGSEGYALGSTASRLARRAPCSVFVAR